MDKIILKNSIWLFGAQALVKIISFFYTVFIARMLGVADFGLYTVALAYFSIISSVADFGFNRFLIREVVRDKTKISGLILNIIILRLVLTLMLFVVFSVLLYLLDPDKMRVSLIFLAVFAVLPQSIALTLDAIFIAIQKLQFSGISLLISSLATTLIGLFLVTYGFGSLGAVNAFIIGQIVYMVILIIFLYRYKIFVLSMISLTIMKQAIGESLPYGLLAILGLFYFKIDTILLSYLKGSFETGIYSAAYKFLEALVFIPSSFSLALFPNIVKLINTDSLRAYKLYLKSTALLFAISLITVIFYLLFLPRVIFFFLPQYLPSIAVIKILALSIPFMFMISIQGIMLFSDKRFLKALIIVSIFNMVLNIVMNFYLIPKYSYFGSAWATLISDIIGFTAFFFYIKVKLKKPK